MSHLYFSLNKKSQQTALIASVWFPTVSASVWYDLWCLLLIWYWPEVLPEGRQAILASMASGSCQTTTPTCPGSVLPGVYVTHESKAWDCCMSVKPGVSSGPEGDFLLQCLEGSLGENVLNLSRFSNTFMCQLYSLKYGNKNLLSLLMTLWVHSPAWFGSEEYSLSLSFCMVCVQGQSVAVCSQQLHQLGGRLRSLLCSGIHVPQAGSSHWNGGWIRYSEPHGDFLWWLSLFWI